MRIAMVSEHASPLAVLGGEDAGGQNVHVAALAMALADRRHTVEVFTRRDAPSLPAVVELHPGVDVVHVPAGPARPIGKDSLPPYMPAFGSWLARRWRASHPENRPDIVHAHFWMSGTAALQARARTGIPVVQTFHALGVVKRRHQGAADTSPPERLAREEHLARSVDAVIATCSDEVRELLSLGACPEKLHIAPCGVDLDAFRPGPSPRVLSMGRRPRRIVSIGRLVERKGVHTLIEALPMVLSRFPSTELVVAGGPDERELDADPHVRSLKAAAVEHGVAGHVRFIGGVARADVPALLRSADVVACVPWYEPFGIVPLEAMACGVPVVGAAVGGLLDSVVHGVTGLLVPPRDPAAAAAALSTVLEDDGLRLRLGRAAAEHVASRFGWPRVAELTEAVYAHVAAPSASAAVPGVDPDGRAVERALA
jgi:D-inositol-3-phosphate glycosyltransferase